MTKCCRNFVTKVQDYKSQPHGSQSGMPSSSPDPMPSDSIADNSAATWRVMHEVLHRNHWAVHSDNQCQILADSFSQYFSNKLDHICQSITTSLQQLIELDCHIHQHTSPMLSQLSSTTVYKVQKLLTVMHQLTCCQQLFCIFCGHLYSHHLHGQLIIYTVPVSSNL